jgi:NAD(P)-dependent dehydrogenase (short-subunit alcohol dehydrogenase family)
MEDRPARQLSAPGRRKVLITGAAGRIGSSFAEQGHAEYDFRLMVQTTEDPAKMETLKHFGEVVRAELSDRARLQELCTGVDTVVHLAADPNPNGTWDSLLPNNIIGTYNLMWAAKSAGCRRVIFASSIHAVGGYGPEVQVKAGDPVHPGDLYGVSKCFGEALGRYMAEQEGLSVIAIRIGGFQPPEQIAAADSVNLADSWISPRDLFQLFDKCIAADHLRWAVFNGLSGNACNRLDISDARQLLGYAPRDDAADIVPSLAKLALRNRLMHHNMKDPWAKSGLRDRAD